MPKISTRITFDKKAAASKIRAAGNEALNILTMQVIKDVDQYVPKDQNFLSDSGLTNSRSEQAHGLTFTLRWDTPYAQYLWHGDVMKGNPTNREYGPDKITFTSAMAKAEWAKYAKEVHGNNWRKVYERALRERLK